MITIRFAILYSTYPIQKPFCREIKEAAFDHLFQKTPATDIGPQMSTKFKCKSLSPLLRLLKAAEEKKAVIVHQYT